MNGSASDTPLRLTIRPVVPGDAHDIWLWRNDPVTRKYSRNAAHVPWVEHSAWFSARLGRPTCAMYMVESADSGGGPGQAVAVVRFDRPPESTEYWTVSLNVRPESRGHGLGRDALVTACRAFFDAYGTQVLRAEIHPRNIASKHVFSALGFVSLGEPGSTEFALFERPPHALPNFTVRRE